MAARKTAAKRTRKKTTVTEIDMGTDASGGSSLVIVESPAKAKTIGKYLGRGYKVKATVGHIMDLPEKKLGIDVEKGFKPTPFPTRGRKRPTASLRVARRPRRPVT